MCYRLWCMLTIPLEYISRLFMILCFLCVTQLDPRWEKMVWPVYEFNPTMPMFFINFNHISRHSLVSVLNALNWAAAWQAIRYSWFQLTLIKCNLKPIIVKWKLNPSQPFLEIGSNQATTRSDYLHLGLLHIYRYNSINISGYYIQNLISNS